MKSTFAGFYSTPSESLGKIWLSESTLFVFDTNCLLNLYRCEDHTREDILKVMKEISSRTWIPFQVGFEYQRKRRIVIEDSISSLTKIKKELEKIHSQNILSSCGVKKHLYNSLNDEISELQNKIKSPIEDYIKDKITPRIQSKQQISQHDFIRDEIDSIIGNNVGIPPTIEQIKAINTEGEERYKNKIPPGFMDFKKTETYFFSGVEIHAKYGDLYLWNEIIEKSKSDNIHNVIFVCDDLKEDWWFIHEGKTHGALAALKTEICEKAKIENFKIVNQLTFLHESKEHLANIEIRESSLKEVEELSNTIMPDVDDENMTLWSRDNVEKIRKNLEDNSSIFKKIATNQVYKNISKSSSFIVSNSANESLQNASNLKHQCLSLLSDIQTFETELNEHIEQDVLTGFIKTLKINLSQIDKLCSKLTSILNQSSIGMYDISEADNIIRELQLYHFIMDSMIEKGNEYLKHIL